MLQSIEKRGLDFAHALYTHGVPEIIQEQVSNLCSEWIVKLNRPYIDKFTANNFKILIKNELIYGGIAAIGYQLWRMNKVRMSISIFVMGLPLFFAIAELLQYRRGNLLEEEIKKRCTLDELQKLTFDNNLGRIFPLIKIQNEDILYNGVDENENSQFLGNFKTNPGYVAEKGESKEGLPHRGTLTIYYFGKEFVRTGRRFDKTLNLYIECKTFISKEQLDNLFHQYRDNRYRSG